MANDRTSPDGLLPAGCDADRLARSATWDYAAALAGLRARLEPTARGLRARAVRFATAMGEGARRLLAGLDAATAGRLRAQPAPEPAPVGIETDLAALAPDRRAKVALALAMLWQAFGQRFDGLDGFLAADRKTQDRYIEDLEALGWRIQRARDTAQAHYLIAVEAMAAYAAHLRDRHRPAAARPHLAALVARLIDEGSGPASVGRGA